MVCPDTLIPFLKEARTSASKRMVAEITFSGSTYQIRCKDGGESFWVFLQLDQSDQARDFFCSCPACVETGACRHMAAAFSSIFDKTFLPLHKRFEASCFSILFRALSEGCDRPVCVRNSALQLRCGKSSVVLSGPSDWLDAIQSMIEPSVEATEETSIKFSNASEDELAAWRRGSAAGRLRFELSALSDVAKHLFSSYDWSFRFEGKEGVPTHFECFSGPRHCVLPLFDLLGAVLDSLPPSHPALEPYGGKSVERIDVVKKALRVTFGGKEESLSSAVPIPGSDWWYVQGSFVKKTLRSPWTIRSSEQIAAFLDAAEPEEKLFEPRYSASVNKNGMTIRAFLETPGDLADAPMWGRWVWLKGQGFRRIAPLWFPEMVHKVSVQDLPEFLSAHKRWLESALHMAVHDHPPEEVVTYEVDAGGALTFHRASKRVFARQAVPLGAWSFVEGEGFFAGSREPPAPYDTPIPPHRVPEFVAQEAAWLKSVPGFFADHSPIVSAGLDIHLALGSVHLSPHIELEERARSFFYDGLGYLSGVGFFPLPAHVEKAGTEVYSPSDREAWDRFFLSRLPELQRLLPCVVDPRLVSPSSLRLVCNGLQPHETSSLWDAGFYWESDQGRVLPDVLVKAYRRHERFLPTDAGLLDLSEERFGWIHSVVHQPSKKCRLRTADFLKIQVHDQFSFSDEVPSETSAIIDRLLRAIPPTPPDLSGFASALRPYQVHGVVWLWHLYSSGLSGLLCDDMGVGKTHQAMALLNAVHNDALAKGRPRPRFLVLCPASLLWHWKDKLASALPHLHVFTYAGGGRASALPEDFDLFLTTYGIWRNEHKTLHTLPFEVAIFDELQIAKNHVSQIWSALSRIRASMRLGLTGTPVENRLRELKAVFDLILPGYLPSGEGALLSRYIRPFVLRRRKQDVLPDLPAKVEDLYPVELVGEQKELYRQVASRQGSPLLQQLRDGEAPVPYLHIFALLSSLKQICDHPAVYLRDTENYASYESGKWNAFVELLEEAHESGQKVVVFSQFLAMLDIMVAHLRSNGIGFAQIRGSTKQRGEEISRFQNDPDCLVFLGSLQASGLGIDLTAGSVVIHYDRWWNAARENQATDRVHRIGQSRGVMVYKLMTAQTVEERIDRMILRKAQMLEEAVAYDDHQILKKLDRAELIDLLQLD